MFERIMKKWPFLVTPIQYGIVIVLYIQCSLVIGVSAFPSVYGVYHYWRSSEAWDSPLRLLVLSLLLAAGYFVYAIVVIFVVGLISIVGRLKIKEGRYYIYSLDAFKWANYNSLILIVRYTCMNFLRVTPFLNLFYRMMGAKIGRNVQINTTIIGDCCLLEIGDHTAVGGDVTLVAHVAEHNHLVVKRVKIGKNVTLGMMSIIMPGVEIGDHVIIAANSVVPKGKHIASHSVWTGFATKRANK